MHVAVVDDLLAQRSGRVGYLERQPGVEPRGLTFEEAFALGEGWRDVRIAVLDGHDRRSQDRRAAAADRAGITLPPFPDYFVGARLAVEIRRHCPPETTRIVLISAYARDDELRARRVAQAGVDYVFDHCEAEVDEETFVRSVLHPESFSPREKPIDWAAKGYSHPPDVIGALTALEASAAGRMLLNDEPHRDHRVHAWSLRRLRTQLGNLLHIAPPPAAGGPRTPRAPEKSRLSEAMRRSLGYDLPRDRE